MWFDVFYIFYIDNKFCKLLIKIPTAEWQNKTDTKDTIILGVQDFWDINWLFGVLHCCWETEVQISWYVRINKVKKNVSCQNAFG